MDSHGHEQYVSQEQADTVHVSSSKTTQNKLDVRQLQLIFRSNIILLIQCAFQIGHRYQLFEINW